MKPFGLDRCAGQLPAVLRSGKFGLLANQASLDVHQRYSWDVLFEATGGGLRAIFSPQHGLWSEQQANMIESPHARHPRLQIPVYSLYSETRRPTPEMLDDHVALVVDLQDVGTRVYTFAWTMAACLEQCAERGIPAVILDRPNPLGGNSFEGRCLEPDFRSFVGEATIPMRHGLTLGELARLLVAEKDLDLELHVVPIEACSRDCLWEAWRRDWIPPSPNLPRWTGVLCYPGLVLLEGTNLSEGRGLTTPFEVAGAPFVDEDLLADTLNRQQQPGVYFRPVRFLPTFDKWAGRSCGGVFFHVTDRSSFQPFWSAASLLATVKHLWPQEFRWLPPPYEYETSRPPIDIISGGAWLREHVEAVADLDDTLNLLRSACECDREAWRSRIEPHLLYR
jgi:uncharacterized protein YbbC (DUF1343 family)